MRVFLLWGVMLLMLPGYVLAEEETEKPELYSLHIDKDNFDVKIEEIERGENFSVAKVKILKGGNSALGAGLCVMKGAHDIAKLRKYDYFFSSGERKGKDGSMVFKFYFLNDKNTPLKTLLGKDYSREAQDLYETAGYMSVEDYGKVFEMAFGNE